MRAVLRFVRFVARATVASILGRRCNAALVEFDPSTLMPNRFGIVIAACDRRDGHVGNHSGPNKRGDRLEW